MSNQTYQDRAYAVSDDGLSKFMTKVFGWMFIGLLITALTSVGFAYLILTNEAVLRISTNGFFLLIMFAIQMVLVFRLSASLTKMGTGKAKLMFSLYAVVTGITLSYIFFSFGLTTIVRAFFMTALFFGIMAVYGLVTKANLGSLSGVFTIGLITLIIASLVNFLLRSPAIDYVICLAGLGLFIGLTAYDVKKMKDIYYSFSGQSGQVIQQGSGEVIYGQGYMTEEQEDTLSKIAIYGALSLYLDFINMFLYVLRLFSRRD